MILKKARSQRPIPTLYDPRPFSIRETNLEQLCLDLLTYNHQCAMLQLLVPPISKVEHDHTYAHSSCHEQLSGSQKSLVVNTDTELKLTSAIKKHIITELTVTTIERQDIEQRTRQQSNSTLHCKNQGVLCTPKQQHTIGVPPIKVCFAHLLKYRCA